MRKAPKKKITSSTESLSQQEAKLATQVEVSQAQGSKLPVKWKSGHEEHSPFVQEFFNFFHRKPNDDEKVSLRVLGI